MENSESRVDPVIEIAFLTLFPEILQPFLQASLLGRAVQNGLIRPYFFQIRDFAHDKHQTVDDNPYGGGAGMLLRVDVLHEAWLAARNSMKNGTQAHTILLSPQGKPLTAKKARELSQLPAVIFVCGHYEGVDERFIEMAVDEEISIGDYVLTGGELPALAVTDALARFVPGVVGKQASVDHDSLEDGLLKYPQYTRPREYEGLAIPEILLEGHHEKIRQWRQAESEKRTKSKRPDLWESYLQKINKE